MSTSAVDDRPLETVTLAASIGLDSENVTVLTSPRSRKPSPAQAIESLALGLNLSGLTRVWARSKRMRSRVPVALAKRSRVRVEGSRGRPRGGR
jgi:hypothetical protein